MGVSLIYIPSRQILEYMGDNPVNWLTDYKHYARRGGVGDSCGVTPTPAVLEFLNLFHEKKRLFTQREYKDYCYEQWNKDGWIDKLSSIQRGGLGVRLYRNFYPSMIDSLYVWSLLAESQQFDICILDSTDDAVGKTDLTLLRDSIEYRIALYAGSRQSVNDRAYKLQHRNDGEQVFCIDVRLPMDRQKGIGNKRWYALEDFDVVIPNEYAMAAD